MIRSNSKGNFPSNLWEKTITNCSIILVGICCRQKMPNYKACFYSVSGLMSNFKAREELETLLNKEEARYISNNRKEVFCLVSVTNQIISSEEAYSSPI